VIGTSVVVGFASLVSVSNSLSRRCKAGIYVHKYIYIYVYVYVYIYIYILRARERERERARARESENSLAFALLLSRVDIRVIAGISAVSASMLHACR
jgi:heme/copper-type cytochrome/quinol oxidase subunit 2